MAYISSSRTNMERSKWGNMAVNASTEWRSPPKLLSTLRAIEQENRIKPRLESLDIKLFQ